MGRTSEPRRWVSLREAPGWRAMRRLTISMVSAPSPISSGRDQRLEDAGQLALEYLEAEAVIRLEGLARIFRAFGHDEERVGLARVGGEEAQGHRQMGHLERIEGADEDPDASRESGIAKLLGKTPQIYGHQATALDLAVDAREGIVEEGSEIVEVPELGDAQVGQILQGIEDARQAAGDALHGRRGERMPRGDGCAHWFSIALSGDRARSISRASRLARENRDGRCQCREFCYNGGHAAGKGRAGESRQHGRYRRALPRAPRPPALPHHDPRRGWKSRVRQSRVDAPDGLRERRPAHLRRVGDQGLRRAGTLARYGRRATGSHEGGSRPCMEVQLGGHRHEPRRPRDHSAHRRRPDGEAPRRARPSRERREIQRFGRGIAPRHRHRPRRRHHLLQRHRRRPLRDTPPPLAGHVPRRMARRAAGRRPSRARPPSARRDRPRRSLSYRRGRGHGGSRLSARKWRRPWAT